MKTIFVVLLLGVLTAVALAPGQRGNGEMGSFPQFSPSSDSGQQGYGFQNVGFPSDGEGFFITLGSGLPPFGSPRNGKEGRFASPRYNGEGRLVPLRGNGEGRFGSPRDNGEGRLDPLRDNGEGRFGPFRDTEEGRFGPSGDRMQGESSGLPPFGSPRNGEEGRFGSPTYNGEGRLVPLRNNGEGRFGPFRDTEQGRFGPSGDRMQGEMQPSEEMRKNLQCLKLIKPNIEGQVFQKQGGKHIMKVLYVLSNETINGVVTEMMKLYGAIDESGALDFDVLSQTIDVNLRNSIIDPVGIKAAVGECIKYTENEELMALAFHGCFFAKCRMILQL